MDIYSAKWIKSSVKKENQVSVFKKHFNVEDVKKATLTVSALGVYKAVINGQRIGEFVLAPGWTCEKYRQQYQFYDITQSVKNENEIEISSGLCWKALRNKNDSEEIDYKSESAIIALIEIEDKNGKQEIITDSSWDVYTSNFTMSHIYNGEDYDANIIPEKLGNAVEIDYKTDILIPQQGEEIREIQDVSAKEVIITPKGDTVIDFGQNLTGYVQFNIKGENGKKVKILHGEILDKDGEFYNANYRSARAEIDFVCDGNEHTFKPQYTFFGFRYIKLVDWCEEIKLENFKAIVVHSNLKRTGYINCSNKDINKLFSNIIWSNKDNFLDVPTDCPQRDERLGWTGDAQIFCQTASYNFDTKKFYEKWLDDVAVEQTEEGQVPHIVPGLDWDCNISSAWADVVTVVPWTVYKTYGDKELLRKNFPMMKKYVDYLDRISTDHLWLGYWHFGDWLDFFAEKGHCDGKTSTDLISSAYFAYSTSLLVKAGKELGIDVSYYENLYAQIKEAYINKFIIDGKVIDEYQTAFVVTLMFDLFNDPKPIVKQLVDSINSYGHMTTGFVGTPYLLPVLSKFGESKTAFDLLLNHSYPSWLYSVDRGATTIWEHWDSINEKGEVWSTEMNSFNHYAYGAVAQWMYENVAGIKNTGIAFENIVFSPETDLRFDFFEASIDTYKGVVSSKWEREADKIHYFFTVPENVNAKAIINGSEYALHCGINEIIINK